MQARGGAGEMTVAQTIVLAILVVVFVSLAWGTWKIRDRFGILGEFLSFLRQRKLWWLMPIIIVFALAGLFVLVTSQSAVSAFIYTLF